MKTTSFLLLFILSFATAWGQEISMGFTASIYSEVLNESRELMIKLPKSYAESDQAYPVLYRLDGGLDLYSETLGAVNRLCYMDEQMPEMIVVMIKNTKRNRDMMPTNTGFFKAEPGAENFKSFIEKELVPYINATYRTSNEKLLCGQSLSAIFTLYCFLTSPNSFDSFVACSGGFPGCEEYFIKLSDAFLETKLPKTTKLFLTHGDKDFLDPQGAIKTQLVSFSQKIESKEHVVCRLKIYTDEGHVPYQSLYHGLRFIYANKQ